MIRQFQVTLPLVFLFGLFSTTVRADEFRLHDGDRVVLLGDGLIEQEQYFGWIEVMLTAGFPDQHVTFRNLGWSADTPAGESRFGLSLLQAGREPADEGWKQLQKQIELTRPTVVVFGYGMASALEGGTDGLDQFAGDFQRLIDAIGKVTPDARFVFLSPLNSIGSTEATKATLAQYAGRVADIAKHHESAYVDLTEAATDPELRKDPIHLNGSGYRSVAVEISKQLNIPDPGKWQDNQQTDSLRETIVRKSQWWFHRSRPANMAYVFGFRKHEQGQNAVEIPRFDALVAKEEQRIAKLRGLAAVELPKAEPVMESQYAKFVAQPTPEFTVGNELEVTLWAENPQLNKPIQMNFDPEGRLWVASSEAYPMIEVGQSAPDKILVLEDTTGDGKADKSTVFADGLLIPTGVEPGEGGVYVAQSTDLLFLKDTDGDGKADVKRRVLSGFGTEDTHHNLHTLRWGFDGRLYMNQSIYTRTDAETPHGVVRLKAGGGFRYDTQTMQMQIFFRGLVNSWGHQYDRYGQSFLSDGAGFQGIAYTFPGATFSHWPTARRVLGLISPGNYPKFASMEIIGGDSFPESWQGSIITNDFRANRVTRFSLSESESGYVTKQEDDLLRTSASTFRPIDVKQGPDGALYIADWSNPIINHGEVDFRDERRDRWHGRIWRVSWKGAKPKKRVNLRELENKHLLENLLSADRFARDQSRRVLFERGDYAKDLIAWASKNRGNDLAHLEIGWLMQGLKQPITDLHQSKDHRIRAAAVRILADFIDPRSENALPWADAAELMEQLVVDEHPRVRLEAICALGPLQTAEAGAIALEALSKPMDRFIEHALGATIDQCGKALMQSITDGQWQADTPQRQKQLEFVLASIDPGQATEFITEHLKKNPIPADGSGRWIELIGKSGGPAQLRLLYDLLAQDHFEPTAAARVMIALDNAARLRKARVFKDAKVIASHLSGDRPVEVRRAAAHLAGTMKLSSMLSQLKATALQNAAPSILRMTSVDSIREIGGPGAVGALGQIAASEIALPVRQRSVIAMAPLNVASAADLFFPLLGELQSQDAQLSAWRGMLTARGAGKALASKAAGASLSKSAAEAGVRACRDGGRNEPELLAALTPLAGLAMENQELTPERMKQLIAMVEKDGHPGRGESVYRRKELACIGCHAIGGVGGKVGPDMTSLGTSAPIDYIIESLYKPSAKVKEGYHAVTVVTDTGSVFNGIEIESNDEELILRNAENKLIQVPQAEIVVKKPGKSLMPTGVIDRLGMQEQIDLIRFLTHLGRPGTYDASKGGVARVYEVFAGTHRIEQHGAQKIVNGEIQKGWIPHLARVSGNLFGGNLRAMTKQPINISLIHIYLRTHVEASSDVMATISAAGPDEAALWIDGKPVEGKTSFETPIKKGKHTLVVRLDARKLPNVFRLTCGDLTFLTDIPAK